MTDSQPKILYMCDFPPSNLRGGSVLVSRLLKTYPQDDLTTLVGSYFDKISPQEGRLNCAHFLFPTTNETGRWGFGRLKTFLDWLLIPVLTAYGLWVIKSRNVSVILTIAHGHFFLATGLISWFTRIPFVLLVHDDWVAANNYDSFVIKHLSATIFKFVAKRASRVYAVTPYMGQMLAEKCGVRAEVQMPAIEPSVHSHDTTDSHRETVDCLRIVYAGTLTAATDDSFRMLLELIKGEELRSFGIESWELSLFVMATSEQAESAGWNHEKIRFNGWVSQDELKLALLSAGVLFLPFSFDKDQHYATAQAFPSKT